MRLVIRRPQQVSPFPPPAELGPAMRRAQISVQVSSQEVPIHMATVDFLVACGAVAITGRPQIVERRRSYAKGSLGIRGGCAARQIGVALQAYEANFLPHQHPWVRGAVWFMTPVTALKTHWCMFECERTTFIGVASEAA